MRWANLSNSNKIILTFNNCKERQEFVMTYESLLSGKVDLIATELRKLQQSAELSITVLNTFRITQSLQLFEKNHPVLPKPEALASAAQNGSSSYAMVQADLQQSIKHSLRKPTSRQVDAPEVKASSAILKKRTKTAMEDDSDYVDQHIKKTRAGRVQPSKDKKARNRESALIYRQRIKEKHQQVSESLEHEQKLNGQLTEANQQLSLEKAQLKTQCKDLLTSRDELMQQNVLQQQQLVHYSGVIDHYRQQLLQLLALPLHLPQAQTFKIMEMLMSTTSSVPANTPLLHGTAPSLLPVQYSAIPDQTNVISDQLKLSK